MTSNSNLTCALSGQCPIADPVVVPTGQICSKKLLLQKLVETNYMNPFTTSDSSSSSAMPLDESQLIELQPSAQDNNANVIPPKPANSNSIPSILNTLHAEYDALVLELYDTRKALEETRKELSVALYQNDAAVRVIARVVLERDLARRQLAENAASASGHVHGHGQAANNSSNKRKRDDVIDAGATVNVVEEERENDVQMQEDSNSNSAAPKDVETTNQIPKDLSTLLQNKWTELFKSRKAKTKAGSNHATIEQIATFKPTAKKYHKTRNKGIGSISSPLFTTDQVLVSSGTSDKQLIWYDMKEQKISKSDQLKKTILNSECLTSYNDVTAVITIDHVLQVYVGNDSTGTLALDNQDEIAGVCIHPTCEHIFVCTKSGKVQMVHVSKSPDGTILLENVATLNGLTTDDSDQDVTVTCMGLHPDGLILALGRNDGKVNIWDLKTEKLGSVLEGSSKSNPTSDILTMTFSEKGYHLAIATNDGNIAIWDLRKMKNITIITIDGDDTVATALCFDPVGKYLSYGTSSSQTVVVPIKDWNNKVVLDEQSKNSNGKVTGLVWGIDAQSIVTSYENDRAIYFWNIQES
mmetsp:Transcript_14569/g.17723  ORF Transcript_14569/g.17723 Transcript_14569/m.17723 type:complete len:583 (+) Transcript_14569:97-1845(+)